MPKLSVWFIRAALLHMGIGFFFGAMILHHKGIPIYDWTWMLLVPHMEIMIFGWTMQLAMGVAYFALPRFSHQPMRYGASYLGWWSLILLNGGVIMGGFSPWYPTFALSGRLMILLAMLLYVALMWRRVKPFATATNAM